MHRVLLLLVVALPAFADPPTPDQWPDLAADKKLFAVPDGPFEVTRKTVGRFPLRVERIEFPSPFKSGDARNDRAYGFYYKPRRPSAKAIVLLPIWKGGDLTLEKSLATSLALLGYKVLVLPAAYQFDRSPKGVRSGKLTLSNDLVRTRKAMIQTVMDARRAATWLRDVEGAKHLGVMGISLGGILASLCYGVDDRFDAGVFLLAGGDLGGLLFVSSETRKMRTQAKGVGLTIEQARKALRAVEPTSYADPRRGAGVLLFAGEKDSSMPKIHVQKLADAWGAKPNWFPRGHYDSWPWLPRMLTLASAHFKARMKP